LIRTKSDAHEGPVTNRAFSRSAPSTLAVAGALFLVYVLWGSTAPAMRLAVATIPPFSMVALRFACSGAILWLWCRARGTPLPRASEWRGAAITGIALLVASNGIFAWTEQYLPSGIASLFFALSPMWMAMFAFGMYGERLSRLAAFGLVLGLVGMLYLYSPTGAQNLPLVPTLLGVFSSVAWAFGAVMQRRFAASDLIQMSAMQMLVAAAVLAIVALAFGERLAVDQFTPTALGGFLYLIVFGSIVGFSAFLWLMNNVPTTLASTYSYVNPLVSIAIGVALLHERFDWHFAVGAAIIVCGVAAMMLGRARRVAIPT
jgi:drug/metabolite transporter (DMT)-like permease